MYNDDEERDPLEIAATPTPTGQVIQRAQLQQAPDTAPTPTHQVDAYATSAPPQPEQQQAVSPAQSPDVPGATQVNPAQEIAQNWDAYRAQPAEEPLIAHRR